MAHTILTMLIAILAIAPLAALASGGGREKPAEGGGGWKDSFSCGVGLFCCLKKIAFPGIGIIAGRNEEFSCDFITLQIGFGHERSGCPFLP